ncbi:Nitrogen regulation protein NR(I) [Anaerohalosphaera lusitana]|uniref:Nitrogen regulation protein NR(I) n=1 Tax=Anaerohalosphaera lusitana TaxID=1936003 RepID=A0A1U9NMG0_9BACT|nr:sigma-54 dependent transcriptional regulator [Anaerohalosphaera lusitana]AQT68918.1 Nitrogen regulation protein NR(I) [Anaerohalosphaera lusitana]
MNKTKGKVLIVDDDKDHADLLVESLQKQCSNAIAAYTAASAKSAIDRDGIDVVIVDYDLRSDTDGLDILQYAKQAKSSTKVILIADQNNTVACEQAIRMGAYEALTKPVDVDSLRLMVSKILPTRGDGKAVEDFEFPGVISRSHYMQGIYKVLRRVAPTNISVLIEGESGTGKELLARAIHENSDRRDNAFKPINCAGLTESLLESELFGHAKGAFTGATADRKGILEQADKGTLFLDEIGDMPLSMQAKLLRVLEDGIVVPVGATKAVVVDVRVVAATNHDLAKLVEEKKFRQDLYFRIKGVSLTIPPLRKRAEDIPELFGFFLRQACEELGRDIHRITESAMSILQSYHWPGNIRQLRHVIRTMVVMCDGDTLDVGDIPPDVHLVKRLSGRVEGQPDMSQDFVAQFTGRSLEEVEREHIRRTLDYTNGNRAEAAKILKIGERTLYRKIKEYDL